MIMERLVLLPGSYFCDILTFAICLYFLKSYIIARGCYIFRVYVKNFFSIPIKFLICKILGWSATKRRITKYSNHAFSQASVYLIS